VDVAQHARTRRALAVVQHAVAEHTDECRLAHLRVPQHGHPHLTRARCLLLVLPMLLLLRLL
jgi:hypothetical protein